MNIHQNHKRRIRIEGKLDETRGYMLRVYDAGSGEAITNIVAITVHLEVQKTNEAEIMYCDTDAEGHFIWNENTEPVERTIVTENPEITVTAYEIERVDEE